MKMATSSAGAIWRINGLLLGASLLTVIAWAIWPSSPEWWGFGLLSIFLGLSVIGMLINAGQTMAKLYAREKAIARIAAISRPQEKIEFADFEALKNAGMIDD